MKDYIASERTALFAIWANVFGRDFGSGVFDAVLNGLDLGTIVVVLISHVVVCLVGDYHIYRGMGSSASLYDLVVTSTL